DAMPNLDPDSTASLLAGLDHPNQLWRLHTQRLLAERAVRVPFGSSEFGALEQRLGSAPTSIHALHLLAQTGGLTPAHLEEALRADHEGTRRAAVRLAPADAVRRRYVAESGVDARGRELAEVLARLAEIEADPSLGSAVYATAKQLGPDLFAERALRDAWTMAARAHAATVLAAARADGRTSDAPVAEENLLPNPGFEDVGAEGRPIGWTDLRHYSGAGRDRITFRAVEGGRTGNTCLQIECAEFTDSGVATTVRLEPGSRYRLSGFVKTVGAVARPNTPGMMLNIHGGPRTRGLAGDQDWTELSVEFDAWQGEHVIHCLFGGYGGARGIARYDDLKLVRISSGQTLDGALVALVEVAAQGGQRAEPVARVHAPDPEVHARGAEVFQRTCIACHGFVGRGVPNVFPPLDDSDWVTGDAELPIRIVLHGLQGPVRVGSGQYQNVMAPLGAALDDQQIADVLTFVRQSWTNDAAPVTAEQVRAVRAATKDRTNMWTAAELGR
ncbi:MAG: c-type cytochrome, partial [Planctomycetota bacterium]|nr:c-type cytochrome [Planctomycetota bacterium]